MQIMGSLPKSSPGDAEDVTSLHSRFTRCDIGVRYLADVPVSDSTDKVWWGDQA